jgi:phage major head subunit gpT-like protein
MSVNVLSSKAIIGRYYETLEGVNMASWVDGISMAFDSTQESETYDWLGMTPAMHEWLGGRQAKGLRDNGITIDNKHFEVTLDVLVEDIRRDKTGQIMVRVDEMAARSVQHWNALLSTLLINAETALCYDGQAFFDTDHSEGDSGTITNDLAVGDYSQLNVTTETNPTANEMADCLLKVIQHMFSFKDDQGEPMNEDAKSFLVMVPVPFLGATLSAVKNQNLATATGLRDNPLPTTEWNIQVAVNPRLTWTTKFAVFRTDARVKPLIRQVEFDSGLKAIAEGSELEFNQGLWRFGVDAWRNVGYGYWQLACLATLS